MHQSSDDSMMMVQNQVRSNSNLSRTGFSPAGQPAGVLRNSCGSPTDSGYRSVPRELDFDTTASVSQNDPLYANSKHFESQNSVNVSKCSVLVDSAPAPQDTLPNTKLTRKGSKATADETSTSCPSPYSDLSSPSYNSSTHSSGSREQTGQRIVPSAGQNNNCLPLKPLAGSFDTINTNVSLPEEFSLDRCPKLVELDRVPWNEKDVVTVLQKGRTSGLVNQIAIDIVPRLTYLLQRPLVRLAKEIQRLCVRFNKCTKHEVQCASKVSVHEGHMSICFCNLFHCRFRLSCLVWSVKVVRKLLCKLRLCI